MARGRAGCGVWLLLWIIIILILMIILLQNPSLLNKKNLSKVKDYVTSVKHKTEKMDLKSLLTNRSSPSLKNISLFKKESPRQTSAFQVDLFFARYVESMDKLKLVRVQRTLPSTDSPLTDTLELLLKGPLPAEEKQGFISLFPAHLQLLGIEIKGSIAYLDFSTELENGVGQSMLKARLYQIVYTATQFPNVRSVKILIDHKEKDSFSAERLSIKHPLKRIQEKENPVF